MYYYPVRFKDSGVSGLKHQKGDNTSCVAEFRDDRYTQKVTNSCTRDHILGVEQEAFKYLNVR